MREPREFSQHICFLDSKFNPPRLYQTIERVECYPFFSQITQKKVTTIIAGAGYGKSTAVADFLNHSGVRFIWFNLEERDMDISVFVTVFMEGINRSYPTFKTNIDEFIDTKIISGLKKESLFPSIVKEAENILTEETIIVFDDYHLLRESEDVNNFFEFLINHLPHHLHMVIISRSELEFPISRLRAQNNLLEISERELSFGLAEIKRLYYDIFEIHLPEKGLELLLKKTEGWVSGIILFYHLVKDKKPLDIPALLHNLGGSSKIIASYLKENLLFNQPHSTKEFLLFTSILSRINPSFCNDLLSIKDSEKLLSQLAENHLFTSCTDEDGKWYQNHPLLKDYMVDTLLETRGKKDFYHLNSRAANLWEKLGEREEALTHYLQAKDWENAIRILNTLIRSLLKESRYQAIGNYLSKLPLEFIEKEPWLLYANGLLSEFRGEFAISINRLQKALSLFIQSNEDEGVDICLIRLCFLYYASGNIDKAKDSLVESSKKVEGNIVLHIYTLINLSGIACVSGKIKEAYLYLGKASPLVERVKDTGITALFYFTKGQYYHFSGDFLKAIEFGKRAHNGFIDIGRHQFQCLSHHLLSSAYFCLGRIEKCLEEARQGLKIAMEYGFKEVSYAWLLLNEAMALNEMGEFSDALASARASEDAFTNIGSQPGIFWAIQTQRDCYFNMGDHDSAREHAEMALNILKNIQLPIALVRANYSLAELHILDGDTNVAWSLLEDGEKILEGSESNFHLARIYLLQTRLLRMKGEQIKALEKLKMALELSDRYGYDFWIGKEEVWIIPLLLQLLIDKFNHDYLKDILAIFKPRKLLEEVNHFVKSKDSGARNMIIEILKDILCAASPPLRIHTLGKFRVFKGDDEIPTATWKSKKAVLLLQYMLTKGRDEFIHKETLMETLWPERSRKASAHNLQVTLSFLRRALEPDLPPYLPSSYILRSGDSYRLDLGKDGWVDRDLFKNEVLKARGDEKTRNTEGVMIHLLEAERIYAGDYLTETLFEDWCEREKERLREEYISVLTKMMLYYEDKGNVHLSIEYAQKILDHDKYLEEVYCKLMGYYHILNERSKIVTTFKHCEATMKEGFDIQPSCETVDMYERLIEEKSRRNNL
ncbi:MAG: BTAD domain-containing putative transcriptional regulator [Thermodesulfobacteriota bacterium]|nr:BTAD domain-containing putative transcriptional regulator [Thermodesulfobacteriota bacterium]